VPANQLGVRFIHSTMLLGKSRQSFRSPEQYEEELKEIQDKEGGQNAELHKKTALIQRSI